jgi:hypothetical protein
MLNLCHAVALHTPRGAGLEARTHGNLEKTLPGVALPPAAGIQTNQIVLIVLEEPFQIARSVIHAQNFNPLGIRPTKDQMSQSSSSTHGARMELPTCPRSLYPLAQPSKDLLSIDALSRLQRIDAPESLRFEFLRLSRHRGQAL